MCVSASVRVISEVEHGVQLFVSSKPNDQIQPLADLAVLRAFSLSISKTNSNVSYMYVITAIMDIEPSDQVEV